MVFKPGFLDLSPTPRAKDKLVLTRRRRRLAGMGNAQPVPVRKATDNLQALVPDDYTGTGIRLRQRFVCRHGPAPGDPSDRRLPERKHRPPATRLMTPRGSTLRLELIALFEAQMHTKGRRGGEPHNTRPLEVSPGERADGQVGWTDLFSSDTVPHDGRSYITPQNKKGQQLRHALHVLRDEQLVSLPQWNQKVRKYDNFALLNEGGIPADGSTNIPYRVPRDREKGVFEVPLPLFTRGWIHVLEDSELAFLLMVIFCQASAPNQPVRIPSSQRLLRFGIGRDAYEAHHLFSALKILSVTTDPKQHLDGKVEDYGKGEPVLPHSFLFLPDGLKEYGPEMVESYLDYQIGR